MKINGLRSEILKNKFSVAKKIFALEKGEIQDRSIYVISAKVVAIAEDRQSDYQNFSDAVRGEGQVLNESEPFLTIRDGVFLPNSGVDESNSLGDFSLLPENSQDSSKRIWSDLRQLSGTKNLGIIISDSCVFPLRKGVASVALGAYGFRAVEDLRGKKDLFDRKTKLAFRNTADMLAGAAALEMGETSEQIPFVKITDANLDFDFAEEDLEMSIKPQNCLFSSYFGINLD